MLFFLQLLSLTVTALCSLYPTLHLLLFTFAFLLVAFLPLWQSSHPLLCFQGLMGLMGCRLCWGYQGRVVRICPNLIYLQTFGYYLCIFIAQGFPFWYVLYRSHQCIRSNLLFTLWKYSSWANWIIVSSVCLLGFVRHASPAQLHHLDTNTEAWFQHV